VTDALLAAAEMAYLEARDAHDRVTMGAARGVLEPDVPDEAAGAAERARAAFGEIRIDDAWTADDRRAYDTMGRWLDESDAGGADADGADADATVPSSDESWAVTAERGYAALSARITAEYARAQSEVDIGDVTVTRLDVLARLGIEPDAHRRRRLFLALEPTWRTIDADGGVASPYQRMLPLSAERWMRGMSPVDRNAAALGIASSGIEPHFVAILATWRDTYAKSPVEPWDWWYAAGAASRALRAAIPLDRLRHVSDAYHASLGADPGALGVRFDIHPRSDRPLVPVAYTEFGRRPRRQPDGTRLPAEAWVMATYAAGGLGELTELIHETGHAIHVAAIDARAAFADWPDSDAFTEALAELTALDTAEPDWQHRWLGASVPVHVGLHDRYADVLLDVCWALFEMRLHADPDQVPAELWAELTSTYLGIVAHPELSWWAMRGQLVQEPGYMVNYALAAIIAADVRAAIRAVRGDWHSGDPGWYGWVSERLYRWGLARSSGDVLRDVLGRAPTADALIAEIGRGRAG
jgi:hypothetical protein